MRMKFILTFVVALASTSKTSTEASEVRRSPFAPPDHDVASSRSSTAISSTTSDKNLKDMKEDLFINKNKSIYQYQQENTSKNDKTCSSKWSSYFTVPVDHFSAQVERPSFKIRILGCSTYAKPDGPIFFYSGNEGSIDSFWDNTGLPFAWAEEFGADIVFAEHRYYGQSLPFGADTFKSAEHMKYLRVEQTLADYAMFMKYYQESQNTKKKVMVLGGSYGGILAAFLRQKYPTVFHMAISASAPIPQNFNMAGHGRSPFTFYNVVTEDARAADPSCPVKVQQAFSLIEAQFKAGGDLSSVQKAFNLCATPKPAEWSHFMQYARNAWTSMAMCDYPYPTDFLAKLPAWPIKAACKAVADAKDDVIAGLAAAVALPYATGDGKCLDMYELFIACADQTGCGVGNDAKAWDYQMCADITIIVASNNSTDMFPERKWELSSLVGYCSKKYGTQPNPVELSVRLGAFQAEDYPESYSNIIFSNGLLDPWHPGGYLEDLTDDVVAIKIPLGAHHLDLRLANEADPTDVIDARNLEKSYAHKWLKTGKYTEAELSEQITRLRKKLEEGYRIMSRRKRLGTTTSAAQNNDNIGQVSQVENPTYYI